MAPVRTKIDDVKYFCALVLVLVLVLGNPREQLPIRTRRDTDDGHQVRAVVLDELDARVLWVPQLQVAIDGRHGDEVRAVLLPNCPSFREEADASCDDHTVDHIVVHETLVVPVCARQMLEKGTFMRENYNKGA